MVQGWDGAETCELVGTYLLNEIKCIIPSSDVGLYRDDGLAVLNMSPREAENTKKKLCGLFTKLGLSITAEVNLKTTDFLDVTLDLGKREYKPYTKPNNKHLYVHKQSNHPPTITKQIPNSIQTRLSTISSNESVFNDAKPEYEQALREAGHHVDLTYKPNTPSKNPTQTQRKRRRKVIWFNPPFSKHVSTNIGNLFLNLVRKNFKKTHPLRTICNRNTLKLSYSCMPNMNNIIKKHNNAILNRNTTTQTNLCNCRDKNTCPLDGKCLTPNVVYEATVTTNAENCEVKKYIGMTGYPFKTRYHQHTASFRHSDKRHNTSLSKQIWKHKDEKTPYTLKWRILKQALPYSTSTDRCNLCNWEKYLIITANKAETLNARTELLAKCPHKRKFLLSEYG